MKNSPTQFAGPSGRFTLGTGFVLMVRNPWYWGRPVDSLLYAIMRRFVGPLHHCCLYWHSDGGELMCEAKGNGVYPRRLEDWMAIWPNREVEVYPLECDPAEITRHFDKKYDRASFLFFLLIRVITRRLGWGPSGRGVWLGRRGVRAQRMLHCLEYAGLTHGIPDVAGILPDELVQQLQYRRAPIFRGRLQIAN